METLIPLDYGTLRMIWWGLLGALLIGFAIMDGFDLGVAALLPLVARTDVERRVALNLVGPVWEGNQVWLITAGGDCCPDARAKRAGRRWRRTGSDRSRRPP